MKAKKKEPRHSPSATCSRSGALAATEKMAFLEKKGVGGS
jgi:hypothetical protein